MRHEVVLADPIIPTKGHLLLIVKGLCESRGLDDTLRVYHAEQLVAYHTLRRADQGWSTVPEHHADLWSAALQVERRPLQTYAEVLPWN